MKRIIYQEKTQRVEGEEGCRSTHCIWKSFCTGKNFWNRRTHRRNESQNPEQKQKSITYSNLSNQLVCVTIAQTKKSQIAQINFVMQRWYQNERHQLKQPTSQPAYATAYFMELIIMSVEPVKAINIINIFIHLVGSLFVAVAATSIPHCRHSWVLMSSLPHRHGVVVVGCCSCYCCSTLSVVPFPFYV